MNTINNTGSSAPVQSGKTKTCISFVRSGLPKTKQLNVSTFSNGDQAGPQWIEWLKEGDNENNLREAYVSRGIAGVKILLGIGKTQAYELIAKLGWRREKIKAEQQKRSDDYSKRLYIKKLKHLLDHHKWIPWMNCCFLDSSVHRYHSPISIGRMRIPSNSRICVSSLPAPSVRDYMKRFGLKYYVTRFEVVPVENVPDTRKRWVTLVDNLRASGKEHDWADEEMSKILAEQTDTQEHSASP